MSEGNPSTSPSNSLFQSPRTNRPLNSSSSLQLEDAILQESLNNQEFLGDEVYRICILGGERTGKSAMLERMLENTFSDYDVPTMQTKKVKKISNKRGQSAFLEILDTGGHLYFDKHPSWISWADGFIVCYDITNLDGFDFVSTIRKHVERIKKTTDLPFIIVGTSRDREARRKITKNQGGELARLYSCDFVEISSKSGENVNSVLVTLMNNMRIRKSVSVNNPLFGKKLRGSPSAENVNDLLSTFSLESPKSNDSKDSLEKLEETNKVLNGNEVDKKEKAKSQRKSFTFRTKIATFFKSSSGSTSSSFLETNLNGDESELKESRALVESYFQSPNRSEESWTEFQLKSEEEGRNESIVKLKSHPLICVECQEEDKFWIDSEEISPQLEPSQLEDIPFYLNIFGMNEHSNMISIGEDSPVIISLETGKDSIEDRKAIVRHRRGTERYSVPFSSSGTALNMMKYLKVRSPEIGDKKFGEYSKETCDDYQLDSLVQELLSYEEKSIPLKYKFGIVYVKDSSQTEDEIFHNNDPSNEFNSFLETIGEKITLEGWEDYRGGLDNRNNNTGTHSIYTRHMKFEIMFHVTPLLPFRPLDSQQLERKRHTGNDVVVVIFKDDDKPFDIRKLKSHYNHVFCIIQVDKEKSNQNETWYRLAFANKSGVIPYGPKVPELCLKGSDFRELFLTKLISAEKAAMNAKEFREKLSRTRQDWLNQIASQFQSKSSNHRDRSPASTLTRHTKEELLLTVTKSQSVDSIELSKAVIDSKRLSKNPKRRSSQFQVVAITDYPSKVYSYVKKLVEWIQKPSTSFDSIEFLFLANEFVQFVVLEIASLSEVDRPSILRNVRSLLAELCSFVSEHNLLLPGNEGELDALKSTIKESLSRFVSSVEIASKHHQEGKTSKKKVTLIEEFKKEDRRKRVSKGLSTSMDNVKAQLQQELTSPLRDSIKHTEESASSLLVSLNQHPLDRESVVEHICEIGRSSKTIFEFDNLLSKTHQKSITKYTEEIMNSGMEFKNKQGEDEIPHKKKRLLSSVTKLMSTLQEIRVDQDIS
eukprot:TRINITY_DN2984_c0_g1_i1.p1 TRINITY_DN2984_c0_g1~~TRINITY_DN2984_c0_g1_i1.p1  ORF type:complete len:1047 (+),score=392.59 TRINITY_DN2984_c0_g1_i1:3496-6636(+)